MRWHLLCCLIACSATGTQAIPADDMVHVTAAKSRGIISAPFWIDRSAVSELALDACIKAGGCRAQPLGPRGLVPATASWSDAAAYCRWRGSRLPTNLELVQAERLVDSETVWASDIDPLRPDHRLTQFLSSRPRGWHWPPIGLDAGSELATGENKFRCARSATHVALESSVAFIPAGLRLMSSCRDRWGDCLTTTWSVVPAFLLDRMEVTNAEYAECVESGSCQSSPYVFPEEPDVAAMVQWEGAGSYCQWRGARLPTATEWVSAVRSGDWLYPWGNEPVESCADVTHENCGNRIPIGSGTRDVTKDGVQDMYGSASEWMKDGLGRPQTRWELYEPTAADPKSWHGVRCARDL